MATAKKNPITNKWDIQIRYKDSFGNNKKKTDISKVIRRKISS